MKCPRPLLRALVVLAIMLLPAVASAQQRPAAQKPAAQTAPTQGLRVVARVNDDAITDFDLSQRVLFAIKTSGLQDSPELRQRMAAQMLRQMVDERLQVQDAKKLGRPAVGLEIQSRYRRDRARRQGCRGASSSCICRASASLPILRCSRSRPRSPGARSSDGRSVPRSTSPRLKSTMR